MQKLTKVVMAIGILAAIVGVGLLIGWWGSAGSAPGPRPAGPNPTQGELAPVNSPPAPAPAPIAAAPPAPVPLPTSPATNVPATTVSTATGPVSLWEDKLDEILGSDDDDTNKVKQLFEMFPRLPEDGQVEVAQHLSNLVSDEDFAPLGRLLQNAKLPEAVLDVLMGDVLNRPNALKLPTLLEVSRNPENPKAQEAKDLMELYLEEEDSAKWPQMLPEWLKENPD